MAFGDNYKPVYEAPTLPDGEYLARIEKAELDVFSKGSGDEYVRVILAIKDHPGYNPNSIFLTEAPRLGAVKANGQPVTQDDVDRANRQLTTFFLCFGIKEGDFDISHWKGHTGMVRIAPQYDKNEPDKKSKVYKTIYPQKPKEERKAAENPLPPPPDPTPATAAPTSKGDSFPEDIPF